MDSQRIDLSPLDPMAEPERWERLVRAITRGAWPELNRRAAVQSPFALLASWARPMLSTAAILILLSAAAIALTRRQTGAPDAPPFGIAGELDVPVPAALWLSEERAPTVVELILAQEGGAQ
ncbi:MAG TPA: hypothetical protein VF188_15475 [Longimicrobiales bacterium]